jgi:integrase
VARLDPAGVERFLAGLADRPSAANHALKMLRRLMRFAIDMGWVQADPTRAARFRPARSDGFYTWTVTDIEMFRAAFPLGTRARLALELGLYTGASRVDIVQLGPGHIVDGMLRYNRSKTSELVVVPVHPALAEALALLPPQQRWFLMHDRRPYTPESVGNWFAARAAEAGVTGGTLHGLRKAMATQLAHAGCSEKQIAAYLGHRSTRQAEIYTRKADKGLLAADAFRALDEWGGGVRANALSLSAPEPGG